MQKTHLSSYLFASHPIPILFYSQIQFSILLSMGYGHSYSSSSSRHLCLILMIFLFPLHSSAGGEEQQQICETESCGEIDIQFPFSLKGENENQGLRCSYPNTAFEFSCNNHRQTIITLPDSGDLVINSINYEEQTIQVNDPNGCLPKRYLQNLSYSVSPFVFDANVYDFYNLTFLRCPANVTEVFPSSVVSCLGDPNNSSWVVISTVWVSTSSILYEYDCEVISWAVVPFPNTAQWPFWPQLTSDIELKWNRPRCGHCAASGHLCGFTTNTTSLEVRCFSDPHQTKGLSRSAKYGLIIGVGIPGLLCIIGLSCFICGKLKMDLYRPSIEHPNRTSIIALSPISLRMGLNGPEIDKLPMTRIGESGRLPTPNQNTCPICLCEYEPKEMLRTIPECKHYFHAHCIDEWLKMNASCPLCRNSPDASSTVTPFSSSISISSSISSPA